MKGTVVIKQLPLKKMVINQKSIASDMVILDSVKSCPVAQAGPYKDILKHTQQGYEKDKHLSLRKINVQGQAT